MKNRTIGTIIHGALGDCYEQLCAIQEIRINTDNLRWVAFFADNNRLAAMQHYRLDMLDEIRPIEEIEDENIDIFFQFQIHDRELKDRVFDKLTERTRRKFNFKSNIKPWHYIRAHNFKKSSMSLTLSDYGREYLPICVQGNEIDVELFNKRLTIGYLWRHRGKNDAVKNYFQKPAQEILKTKSELFQRLISEFNAHIFICGMKKGAKPTTDKTVEVDRKAVFVEGEYRSKFTDLTLDIDQRHCTYMKGLGYAAEMEILSQCDLCFVMPSGFSEPLWMMKRRPVVLVDPPPVYMAKLIFNRMPLFDNLQPRFAYYNTFASHTAENILRFVIKNNMLARK